MAEDFKIDLKLSTSEAEKKVSALEARLEKLSKAIKVQVEAKGGSGGGGIKSGSARDALALFSSETTRTGRGLDVINAKYGIGSKQAIQFGKAVAQSGKFTALAANAQRELKAAFDAGEISASKFAAQISRLRNAQALLSNKLNNRTPFRQVQGGVGNIAGALSTFFPQITQIQTALGALTEISKIGFGVGGTGSGFFPTANQDITREARNALAARIAGRAGTSDAFVQSLKEANPELSSLGATGAEVQAVFAGLTGVFAGATIAILGLGAAGVNAAANLERDTFKIASLLSTSAEAFDPLTGKAVSFGEKFQFNLGKARELIQGFRQDAAQLAGVELSDLTEAATTGIGLLQSKGVLEAQQQRQIIGNLVSAIKPLTAGQANQIPQEIRALLTGKIDRTSTVGQAIVAGQFGGNKQAFLKELEKAEKEGGEAFGNFIKKITQPFRDSIEQAANTFENRLSILKTGIETFFQFLGAPALEAAKGFLDAIAGVLVEADGTLKESVKAQAETIGTAFGQVTKALIPAIEPIGKILLQVLDITAKLITALSPLLEVMVALGAAVLTTLEPGLAALASILGALTSAIAPVLELFASLLSSIAQNEIGARALSIGLVALVAIFNPVAAAIAAIIGLASTLLQGFQSLAMKVVELSGNTLSLNEGIGLLITALGVLVTAFNPVVGVLVQVTGALVAANDWINRNFGSWSAFASIIPSLIVSAFGRAASAILGTLRTIGGAIDSFFGMAGIKSNLAGIVPKPGVLEGAAAGNIAGVRAGLGGTGAKGRSLDIKNASRGSEGGGGGKNSGGKDALDKAERELKNARELAKFERGLIEIRKQLAASTAELAEAEAQISTRREQLQTDSSAIKDAKAVEETEKKRLSVAREANLITQKDFNNRLKQIDANLISLERSQLELEIKEAQLRVDEAQLRTQRETNVGIADELKAQTELAKLDQQIAQKAAEPAKDAAEKLNLQKELEALQLQRDKALQDLAELQATVSAKVVKAITDESFAQSDLRRVRGEGQSRITAIEAQASLDAQFRAIAEAKTGYASIFNDGGKQLFSSVFQALSAGGENLGQNILNAFKQAGANILQRVFDRFLDGLFEGKGIPGLSGLLTSAKVSGNSDGGIFDGAGNLVQSFGDATESVDGFGQKCNQSTGLLGKFVGGIQNLFSSFSSGGNVLGAIGGAVGIAASIGGVVFGIFDAISGIFKAKKDKLEQEQLQQITFIVDQLDGRIATIDKRLERRLTQLDEALLPLDRQLSKLDSGESVFQAAEAITLTYQKIFETTKVLGNEIVTTLKDGSRIISTDLVNNAQKAADNVATIAIGVEAAREAERQALTKRQAQLQGILKNAATNKVREEATAELGQIRVKLKQLDEKYDSQALELNEQIKDYQDEIAELIETQQELIMSFDREIKRLRIESDLGEGFEGIIDQVFEFQDQLEEYIRSGLDPTLVAEFAASAKIKLEKDIKRQVEQVEEAFRSALEGFANAVLGLGNELLGVVTEGRVTGRVQASRDDKVADIRRRLENEYAKFEKESSDLNEQFADGTLTATEALARFTEELNAATLNVLNAQGQSLTSMVTVQVFDPKVVADEVKKQLSAQGLLTGAIL